VKGMIARGVVVDRIKLLVAALMFVIGMCAVGVLVAAPLFDRHSKLAAALVLIAFVVLLAATMALFNVRARARRVSIAELEAHGLLVDRAYKARRAFEVEEFEDEGASFFIELLDGSVLFLSGQYLWDYDGKGKAPQPRRFPCSEFVVRRHVTEHWVAEVVCGGTVLEPECTSPPLFSGVFSDLFRENDLPADGDIVRAKTYDELKLKLTAASRL
jgi:hypothetical protein